MHFVSFFKINKITILPCGIFLLRANRLDKITGIKVLHYYSICMHLETDWFGMVHKYVYLPRWIKNKFIELSCLFVLYCLFCIINSCSSRSGSNTCIYLYIPTFTNVLTGQIIQPCFVQKPKKGFQHCLIKQIKVHARSSVQVKVQVQPQSLIHGEEGSERGLIWVVWRQVK